MFEEEKMIIYFPPVNNERVQIQTNEKYYIELFLHKYALEKRSYQRDFRDEKTFL